jgi:hypothetical protein
MSADPVRPQEAAERRGNRQLRVIGCSRLVLGTETILSRLAGASGQVSTKARELQMRSAESQRACPTSSTTPALTPTVYAPSSATSAEANTLRLRHDETRAKAERLEADVARLRTDAHRAIAERNAAQTAPARLRRAPASHAYITPRPVAFRDLEPVPSWRIRAVVASLVVAVLAQLLFGVL